MKANDRLNSVSVFNIIGFHLSAKTATLFNLSLVFIFLLKLFRGQIYSAIV